MKKHHISVLLADDHELILQGAKIMLADTPNMHVIGTAANGKEAVKVALQLNPDIVLMDVQMPKMDGIEATKKILKKNKKIKIIMISVTAKKEYIEEAFLVGASGYVLKGLPSQEIINTIKMVFSGEKRFIYQAPLVLAPKILSPINKALFSQLSQKENEVLALILKGYNIHEMAKALLREERTIRMHKENIRKKLNVETDVQIIMLAVQAGFYHNL